MFDEKLKVAYDTSDFVVAKLDEDEITGMVSTARLVRIVEKRLDCKIKIISGDFKDIDEKIKSFGAMMLTNTSENGERRATILLNRSKDEKFQRFSLVHELGHLMTVGEEIFNVDVDDYIVSTHIDYRVTAISKKQYEQDEFLLGEQNANIFALRTLMPNKQFFETIEKKDSISEVADYFGVSTDAVISRIMLVS